MNTGKHRQAKSYTGLPANIGEHRLTQAKTGKHRLAQANTVKHRQAQANTGKHRQTQADTGEQRETRARGPMSDQRWFFGFPAGRVCQADSSAATVLTSSQPGSKHGATAERRGPLISHGRLPFGAIALTCTSADLLRWLETRPSPP